MLNKCSNLIKLSFDSFEIEDISYSNIMIEHDFSKIMELYFFDTQEVLRDYFINRCQESLLNLTVENFNKDEDNIELKLPNLPNLRKFECFRYKIKPRTLILLLQSSPDLEFLEIDFYEEESYEDFLKYLESKKGSYKLTYLNICGSEILTEEEKKRFTNLRLIDITFD